MECSPRYRLIAAETASQIAWRAVHPETRSRRVPDRSNSPTPQTDDASPSSHSIASPSCQFSNTLTITNSPYLDADSYLLPILMSVQMWVIESSSGRLQCSDRDVVRIPESRTVARGNLLLSACCQRCSHRMDTLVQPEATALDDRLSESGRVRAGLAAGAVQTCGLNDLGYGRVKITNCAIPTLPQPRLRRRGLSPQTRRIWSTHPEGKVTCGHQF